MGSLSFSDKAKAHRRKIGPWTAEDEREWLEKFPDDEPHPVLAGTDDPPSSDDQPAGAVRSDSKISEHGTFDEDLIPPNDLPQRTEQDDQIDRLLDAVGIVEAYTRWCGKSQVGAGNRTEGIKVSCPNPLHPDKNPSAWLNTEKNVWACGACNFSGGDAYDIAAWHFGFPVPEYKVGKKFHELRERMAEDLGYRVVRTLAGKTKVEPVQEAESQSDKVSVTERKQDDADPEPSDSPSDEENSQPESNVVYLPRAEEMLRDDEHSMPSIAWRTLLPDDTFLKSWLEATEHDDLPEEYYFWLGLQALGIACGNDIVLHDNPPVKGNLFVCLLGPTGIGKSRSTGAVLALLNEAMPFHAEEEYPKGAYLVPSPGSPESLIDAFSKPVEDYGATPPKIVDYAPIRGLVRFDELATLIGRSQRTGSPMKPMLMEFYDSYNIVEHKTRGHGHVKAVGHFAACVTTTQIRAIRNLVLRADVDSGFLNRWVFAVGPAKERIAHGRKEHDLTIPLEKLRRAYSWATTHATHLKFTRSAAAAWETFFHDVIVPAQSLEENELLIRADLTMKKLMLLFAANEHKTSINLEAVESAISLWDYLFRSYKVLGGQIGVSEIDDCIESVCRVVTYQESINLPTTKRNIVRSMNSRKHPSELISKTLKVMLELGLLEEVAVKAGNGRTIETYQLAQ